MPGRKYNSAEYRYGFNGKEKDDEGEFGSITNYDYGFRIYNPAVGRFLSVDPLTKAYPWYTPYQFAGNKPIWAIDLDGLEELIFTESAKPYLSGINAIIAADDELIKEYNSYQIEDKKHIKIYIKAERVESDPTIAFLTDSKAFTEDITGVIHYYKQLTDYLVDTGKEIGSMGETEQKSFNRGKRDAEELGIAISEISLDNEYHKITINKRWRPATNVGDENRGPYTWQELLLGNVATLFHEIKGHAIYRGKTGIDEHNYLFGFDEFSDWYTETEMESFLDPKRKASPSLERAHPKSVFGKVITIIKRAVEKVSNNEKSKNENKE